MSPDAAEGLTEGPKMGMMLVSWGPRVLTRVQGTQGDQGQKDGKVRPCRLCKGRGLQLRPQHLWKLEDTATLEPPEEPALPTWI